MAALKRLKEAASLVSSDQSRVALHRLPLPLCITRLEPVPSSVSPLLSKPCIPPALGPRPTEAPCSPPPSYSSANSYHRYHHRRLQNSCHDVHEIESKSTSSVVSMYQWTNGISALTRDLLWFRSSSECDDRKTTALSDVYVDPSGVHRYHTLLLQLLQDTTTKHRDCHHHMHSSQPSLSSHSTGQLYSLNESPRQQSQFGAVVLQQADRLERAQEPPAAEQQSQQEERGHLQKQVERRGLGEVPGGRRGRRLPSDDKATPAQMSVILLKLREELPAFFDGHHSYNIYDANMKFENNLLPQSWSTDTRQSYRMFLESSRLALKLSFSRTTLDLIKITKDMDHGKIEARWRVRGRPRYFLSLRERVLIEGFSTFLVNSSGLISLHRMDRVMPAPTKEKLRSSWRVWLGNLVGVASPKSPLPQPDLVNSSKHC